MSSSTNDKHFAYLWLLDCETVAVWFSLGTKTTWFGSGKHHVWVKIRTYLTNIPMYHTLCMFKPKQYYNLITYWTPTLVSCRKVIHPTTPITFCASRNDAWEETKAPFFKVHWPGCRVWVVGIENRLTIQLHHLCMSSLHYKNVLYWIQSCLAVGCRPPLANLSAECGRHEHTQRHDWPVAPRTRSAPLRIILLVFHDSLPVWSLTVRRVTEILQGLKWRAVAPTTTRFHLGAVLPPPPETKQ